VFELFLRLVVSMAVVMAVMGLAAKFARRRQGAFGGGSSYARKPGQRPATTAGRLAGQGRDSATRSRRARQVPPLDIVYRRPLAKGAWVAVVQAGERRYMLGVTEQAVNLLGELRPEDTFGGSPADSHPVAGYGIPGADHPAGAELDEMPLTLADIIPEAGRTPAPSEVSPPAGGQPENAWKLIVESLRERTVRR
jgi:hypothetical protein